MSLGLLHVFINQGTKPGKGEIFIAPRLIIRANLKEDDRGAEINTKWCVACACHLRLAQ